MRVLDLGTGTGCLLLAALSEYPHAWGIGIDLSPAACRLAARNAAANGLAARAALLCGDWARALVGRFDVILANPPYIPAPELRRADAGGRPATSPGGRSMADRTDSASIGT